MHFIIRTFKIIIFANLFSNIITKQNENTTTKNNTHTMKESDDDEYVDIKNNELDNNIKRNEFDEFKDYVLKNTDVLIALIISVLAVCVCMLVIVIMNCSRWENISECNRQCIKRNYLIVRNCCRGDSKQPSYHPEHSCEDFCRWCCTYDYFDFHKSIPNPHQPKRAERLERAKCAQCAERAQRVERAEVVAEPSVTYDGSNVSIEKHDANFRKSNPNPDHQPERAERAERAQFAERAQRVERAQVHAEAEPSIICDWSSVSKT
ncbi:uncharacterized protein LOC115233904 [Formica exsecta]|uniref:uncharacterized protein LOC115233904 n=1 Tax=Formica exsecta TaxID=72781 RepID=UPI001142EE7C|nr:uncharacterized protein LOC115233904 [Formica exsecta]